MLWNVPIRGRASADRIGTVLRTDGPGCGERLHVRQWSGGAPMIRSEEKKRSVSRDGAILAIRLVVERG